MIKQKWQTIAIGATLAGATFGQNFPRQATMVGGDRDRGKCTVEVVVDDVAQVEIRGANAVLKTLAGQPAQWRRFECNAPLPPNPQDFRFAGVDGRGRQTLIRDPRQGGTAVVQIEDKDGGAEGYTFNLFWETRAGGPPPPPPPPTYNDRDRDRGQGQDRDRDRADDRGQYRPGYRDSDYYRRYQHGFAPDEAVRLCQQAISNKASARFRSADVHFHRTAMDDGPGRQDWVTGTLDVPRRDGDEMQFRFSCSVDFQAGRIRTADIDERPMQVERRGR